MPMPHDTDNYTIPGGIKLYFDDGSGERDLGNITDLDIESSTDELEHYSSRSGKRMRDKIIALSEKLTLKFKLDEPAIENLRYYFKGGSVENVGSGTDSVTDLTLTLTGEVLHPVGQYYGLSNVTVRQFLDNVFRYDGAAYVDNSVEADTIGGTPFTALADSDDILYLGKNTKFKEVYFDLQTTGSYTGISWEYWNGTSWSALTVSGAGANLSADGPVNFTPPSGWAKTKVNNKDAYWIRVKATSVTTAATVNSIRQNLTRNTDWVLDPGQAGADGRLQGRIGRLSGGKIVDGEEVKASFDYTTWTSARFSIAGSSFVEGASRLEVHPDAGRGLRFDVVLTKTLLKPNGAIAIDDSKWLELPMTIEALDDSDRYPTAPYGYIVSYDV